MSELNTTMTCTYSEVSTKYALMLPLVLSPGHDAIHPYAMTIVPPFYLLLSLLGILGNLYSLCACLRPSQPWSISTIGFVNMAISNVAYLVTLPAWAVSLGDSYEWNMSHPVCVLANILSVAGLASDSMFICAISTDRFLAITFPLESRLVRTQRNAVLVSLLLWVVTLLLVYLNYSNIVYVEYPDGTAYCGILVLSKHRLQGAAYSLLSYFVVQTLIPLFLIIPSYVRILARLRQLQKQWHAGNMRGRGRSIWLAALFIANFLVCWLPAQLLQTITFIVFVTLHESTSPCWMAEIINSMMVASAVFNGINACLDPFILHRQMDSVLLKCMVCQGKRNACQDEEEEDKAASPVSSISVVLPQANS